jgi:hypothetical protein
MLQNLCGYLDLTMWMTYLHYELLLGLKLIGKPWYLKERIPSLINEINASQCKYSSKKKS